MIKARLYGVKASGGAVEVLVERVLPGHEVLAHLRASKSPRPGSVLRLAGAFDAEVLGRGGPDGSLFTCASRAEPLALLAAHGHVPLPPYITHADDSDDERRYQTVFADAAGRGGGTDRGTALRRGRAGGAARARRGYGPA